MEPDETPAAGAREHVARLRERNPGATPAQVIRTLERTHISALARTGAAVGGAAGAGRALALPAGATPLELSSLFVLSVAEVHGSPVDEVERRRAIVLGVLLGEAGSAAIGEVAGRAGQRWGRRVTRVLGKRSGTGHGAEHGVVGLGRVAPFGVGAVLGGGANAALGVLAVRAARRAFGPPPVTWPCAPACPDGQVPATGSAG
ncbi:hypothetical protein ACOBQX_06730 [Actinokineospora sp. G85]|uniref:hypothetical protein n=1 Tax=Actinokineospora sp. G85 TaxID=3406626 RepID=UPI003C7606C5